MNCVARFNFGVRLPCLGVIHMFEVQVSGGHFGAVLEVFGANFGIFEVMFDEVGFWEAEELEFV